MPPHEINERVAVVETIVKLMAGNIADLTGDVKGILAAINKFKGSLVSLIFLATTTQSVIVVVLEHFLNTIK